MLDADALVAFQGATADLRALAAGASLVLTPHPGEFRTLFPALAARRVRSIRGRPPTSAAAESGATVLLKGVPTVVAHGPVRRSRSPPAIRVSRPAAAATC